MFLIPRGGLVSGEVQRRIRTCLECHRACLRAAVAHLGRRDPKAAAPLARAILDCSQTCLIAADFITRMPSLSAELCAACAAACEACAEHCRRIAGDLPGMQECAEDCRRCADICRGTVPTGRSGGAVS